MCFFKKQKNIFNKINSKKNYNLSIFQLIKIILKRFSCNPLSRFWWVSRDFFPVFF